MIRDTAIVARLAAVTLAVALLSSGCSTDPCEAEYGDGFAEIPDNGWSGRARYCYNGVVEEPHPDFG